VSLDSGWTAKLARWGEFVAALIQFVTSPESAGLKLRRATVVSAVPDRDGQFAKICGPDAGARVQQYRGLLAAREHARPGRAR
jgi:hypothetical protein